MKWVETDANGLVMRAGQSGALPAGATEVVTALPPSVLARMQMVEGAPVPRPAAPAMNSSGNVHTIGPCPVGTVIEVHDLTGGEIAAVHTVAVAGEDVEITLADAGDYRIEVAPPAPVLPASYPVVVS